MLHETVERQAQPQSVSPMYAMTFGSVTQEWDKVRPHKELSDLDLRFVKWNTTLTSVSFDVMVKNSMWVYCRVFLTHS